MLPISTAIYWLAVGVFCFAMEAFGLTGAGLFFAGLGALCLSILVHLGVVGEMSWTAQFAWFFGLTALWAALLWQPLKNYRIRKRKSDYSNTVGERGVVVEMPLVQGKDCKVKWSGAVMIAELHKDSSIDEIAIGETVTIKEIEGNRLVVDKA